MSDNLLPCPFCGGVAEMDSRQGYRALVGGNLGNAVAIYCTGCGAQHTACHEDHRDMAIDDICEMVRDQWNKRPGVAEKLFYDLFSDGRWIGMAQGVDEDDAKRMAARSLPGLMGHFTLIRWHDRLHPDNCKSSGGKLPDPLPEPFEPWTERAVEAGAQALAQSPLLNSDLPVHCWNGLARKVLESAVQSGLG